MGGSAALRLALAAALALAAPAASAAVVAEAAAASRGAALPVLPPAAAAASIGSFAAAPTVALAAPSAEFAPALTPAAAFGGEAAPLAAALVGGGASPEFVAAVRARVAETYPPAVLRALLAAGYRVAVDAHVRQNRPDLDESKDLVGGYHERGPDGGLVVIGETVKSASDGHWEKSRGWENAIHHEFGLAIGRVLGEAAAAKSADASQAAWYRAHGISESPEFRDAWRRDHAAIPDELKSEKDRDGEFNAFYYYLKPDAEGFFHEAREFTFAEGLDVLVRGERSAYNHDDFQLHFPNALAALRQELRNGFGWEPPPPAPAPGRFGPWDDASADSTRLADLLVSGAAKPEFVAKVRALVARSFTPELIRDLLRAGYRVSADERVRQGREGLHPDNDTRGGFHSHGPEGNLIVVAEKVKLIGSERWVDSEFWENAVVHEIGHALAYIHGEAEARRVGRADARQARWYRLKGLSESPEFRRAWNDDFDAMPADLKRQWTEKKLSNPFYYFVHPDPGGWYQRARQETFAEGFDVLVRGSRSSYNHDAFVARFPRALAVIRAELGGRYPGLFPADAPR